MGIIIIIMIINGIPGNITAKIRQFPGEFGRNNGSQSKIIIGRSLLRRDRRQILTYFAALSQDKSSLSASTSRACTDESEPEPPSSNDRRRREWLHFVGVGGCGISALAMLALEQGYEVSGSDLEWTSFMDRLQESGARLYIGHSESNIRIDSKNGAILPNALIISSAIPQNNVEVQHAKSFGVPVHKRDYWLGKLTENHKLIAISGTHGKSTTASMLAYVLKEMGNDLTAVVGAEVPQFRAGNIISGSSETFILEADEYDNCFLKLSPYMAVVTNLEWEHVDIFPDEEAVKNVFRKFLNQIRKGGHLIVCGDSEGAYSLLNRSNEETESAASMGEMFVSSLEQCDYSYKITTFGISSSNEWNASSIRQNSEGGSDFTLCHWGSPVAEFSLQIPGIHNVLNSVAVVATVVAMIGNERRVFDCLRLHLKNFRGVSRRFETIGSIYSCHIVDDYAHHPTEIRAIIQAARQKFPSKALLVVFQPHTYSRLAALMDDFAIALSGADEVVITDVYASREPDHCSVNGNKLSAAINGPPSEYIASLDIVVDKLVNQICADPHRDIVVLTLGAGDITTVGPKLLNKLQERLQVPNSSLLSSTATFEC